MEFRKIHWFLLWGMVVSQLLLTAALPNPEKGPANQLTVEKIEITGNSKTRQSVILSLLDFKVGDKIDEARLERNRRRLEESGFFKEVSLYTQPGSQRGLLMVYVEIRERHWPYFQFKSGYNELDGWYISPLGIRFDNLFGRGNRMGFEFFIGDRVNGTDIEFAKQNIFNSDFNLRVLLFSRNREFVHYVDNDKFLQTVQQGGISLRLNSNQGLLKYLWIEFIREAYRADDFMTPARKEKDHIALPGLLQSDSGKREVGRLVLSLYVDTRDYRRYPTRGWWGSFSFDQVSTQFGAFSDYKKAIFDVRRYQEISNQWVLAARFKAAWVDDKAPFYEKFYLGGPNSLRGYRDRGLNPLGYASRLVQGSVELRFPLTRKNFPNQFATGVLFYDIGQAWNQSISYDKRNYHSSVGYGLRFKLPIVGLLRIDFAYPIPTYEFRLHISLGHTF